jgi:uncharacterized protein
MGQQLDLTQRVYTLTEQYPELIGILKEVGLIGIANPVMRNTVGRVMTIPQGCEKMGYALDDVLAVLKSKGFEVISLPS